MTVNGTETVVTKLTPGADYTFSVTAENAVSSQDMNIFDRTVNITATTKEGGKDMYIPHHNSNCTCNYRGTACTEISEIWSGILDAHPYTWRLGGLGSEF